VKFCPNCGTRLRPKQIRADVGALIAMYCDRCGFNSPLIEPITSSEGEASEYQIKVVGEREEEIKTMPTIEEKCPKCGNMEAYWWMLQTRGGDEPTTQFYRCTKCSHTWRHYA